MDAGETASIDDLQAEIERAEISRRVFDREFETMRRAVATKVRKKTDLFVWLKAKGFAQTHNEFLALWAKKALEARTTQRGPGANPASPDQIGN